MGDVRQAGLEAWGREAMAARGQGVPPGSHLYAISGDASFRRYFRFDAGAAGWVFVDAPPAREDSPSFVRISAGLRAQGLCCPEVLAADLEQGFMAVTDLGDRQFLAALQESPAEAAQLYDQALEMLAPIRQTQVEGGLPAYDRQQLEMEMLLFDDWFLARHLRSAPSPGEARTLAETRELLIASALAQPQVFVHRDYHSRNLMVQADGSLGILDFQDAVTGPLTYDLVSLLKDCYHRLPRAEVEARVEAYRIQAAAETDAEQFLEWFDLMGAQRHLKCAGIFCRLCYRDGKPAYLEDIPLVLDYLREVAARYAPLAPLGALLAHLPAPKAPAE